MNNELTLKNKSWSPDMHMRAGKPFVGQNDLKMAIFMCFSTVFAQNKDFGGYIKYVQCA